MEIDNFDIFRSHLDFKEKTDRYIIHILRRPKDCKTISNAWGSNECQRLLRTYYVDSIEYFDKKRDAIKELCTTNRARAYIIPQVRDNFECLLNLGEKVLETIRLGNFSAKPEHLLRSAYCEYHKSRKKMWIIDLDDDNMVEYKDEPESSVIASGSAIRREWYACEVLGFVRERLVEVGKSPDDAYYVRTKSGFHIITSPFDLHNAFDKCHMMFEGEHTVITDVVSTGPGEFACQKRTIRGWLHKDGMSLLYLNLD